MKGLLSCRLVSFGTEVIITYLASQKTVLFSDVAQNVEAKSGPDDEADGLMSSRHLPNVDISNCAAFTKLEVELASAQKALKLKQEEVDRLSKIREEVTNFIFAI